MMPKTGFQTCREIIIDLAKHGYKKEASFRSVNLSIGRCAGFDSRTRKKYFKALLEVGFIRKKAENLFTLCSPGGSE